MKPFIKWAGGKSWLLKNNQFILPEFDGRYIEPFLGGAAVFFHLAPKQAILSDVNPKLINTYRAIRSDWRLVRKELGRMQYLHSKEFYYQERDRVRRKSHTKAAQFLYLNRTCWNGLYRENLSGKFNVPIGTKSQVLLADDDFKGASSLLESAELKVCDFEETLSDARSGDLVFLDPPYTTAHNTNGFIKYNQNIFSWDDQIRLRQCTEAALNRGAKVVLTNANHETIHKLYTDLGTPEVLSRASVISGSARARG
ncbi:MAG: Dam family site-specific DNA-(adenine-N6)-methyltransferase [Rhodobacteraceae bacterium]|nr:Dam family site-specific DNA-(adenine-N6)-methyltransferase [Paracoccaceae bacterium]